MGLVTTPWIGRRTVVTGLSATAAALLAGQHTVRAQAPAPAVTPPQTLGPFYPVEWAGDADNDLVVVKGEAAKAIGQVVHVSGRVLNLAGQPSAGAIVEIWQCDARGIYRHPRDTGADRVFDGGFQGRGRTSTDSAGKYAFRTIRPVPYPGRTPHIHFKVQAPAGQPLVTQMYVFGEKLNERDGILQGIRDPRQRDSIIVRLDAADGIEAGALAGVFDIVIA